MDSLDDSYLLTMEGSLHKDHEGKITGQGTNSLSHYNLVHTFIPMPQAMKIPAAKVAVDKVRENLRRYRHGR